MKLLHIDSSILGNSSVSRELSSSVVARLREVHPNLDVTYRDLAAEPVPHLSGGYLAATSDTLVSENFRSELTASANIMDEFLGADIVVIGAPMYNFAIPTQLKAWIDRIAVAGKTFRYSEKGAEGLAGGKRMFLAVSRGNIYSNGAAAAPLDFQEPYLRAVFNFLGVTDIEVIRAEGIAFGPDQRNVALAEAHKAITVL